ncbi:AFP [Cervus elaphus hippelaphus]|uniref:AFP n=1 Tax=Cervus elaphus hippelaphus TaxID=46360 RepID=A0A212D5Z9_CEREH|nr:AFP [Cervus elaphus hippelaphus]
MKTVRSISFLIFFSYIRCQTLQRSLLDAAMQQTNGQNYLEENLRAVTSIMVAQFLQKVTYEEVQIIVHELLDLAEKCKSLKSHELPSESCHQLMAAFLEHICNNQGMADKCVFSDCCNINKTARHKCFLLHKKDDTGYTEIFQISNPEQICEIGKENQVPVKDRYIYGTSRKHPFLYGPTILTMSVCYETALEPIRKYVREISLRHHHLCEIGIKFNHKVATAMELVLLTKKQPKANFSEITKLATDIKNLHQICCEGNAVVCVLGRSQLMNYICSKQAILSSKFSPCCELPEPFRGECIINSENDDKPDLSPLPLRRFTEDQSVCKQFTDKQDFFLQEFLYEYTRRHPELAVSVILRVDAVYQNLLGRCCKLENPLECYSHGGCFKEWFVKSHERVKNQCDVREKLGDSNFHDRYASKMLSRLCRFC